MCKKGMSLLRICPENKEGAMVEDPWRLRSHLGEVGWNLRRLVRPTMVVKIHPDSVVKLRDVLLASSPVSFTSRSCWETLSCTIRALP